MADFTAASVSAVRDTMITLQPSAAKTPAVARPIPFEPPVISAVFPASFRSMRVSRSEGGNGRVCGQKRRRQHPLRHGGCDHAANALAMAGPRGKAEVARGSLDIHWTARSFRLGDINLKSHRPAGGRTRR